MVGVSYFFSVGAFFFLPFAMPVCLKNVIIGCSVCAIPYVAIFRFRVVNANAADTSCASLGWRGRAAACTEHKGASTTPSAALMVAGSGRSLPETNV